MFFEPLAEPGVRLSRQHIDRRLVTLVQMRPGAGAGRDRQEVHADAGRAHGFRRDALEIAEPLPSGMSAAGANHATARIG
ncbi:hypothetical protein D3C72_2090270 [compost metagenome]